MEFDLIEKIVLAVACPVLTSVLVAAFYFSQSKWGQRRDQRWWDSRDAEWIDDDVETYAQELRGAK